MGSDVFTVGYTSGSAQDVLNAARDRRFTGTIAFRAGAGWLLALVVAGESEQFARLGEYPGVRHTGQYLAEYAHDARLSAELPAQAGWPRLPATAAWAPALVPWPIVQRGLHDFTGFVFLTDEVGTACFVERGRVMLVRTASGAAPATVFPAAYEQAAHAHLAPVPPEFVPALHTATPPAEFLRGSSVVLTLSNPAPLPAATEPEPAATVAPRSVVEPPTPVAEAPAPPAAPEPVPEPALGVMYRLTLRGADALDPMNDRAAEFRADFPAEALTVLRTIRAQRFPDASAALLLELAAAGYIYEPEDAR